MIVEVSRRIKSAFDGDGGELRPDADELAHLIGQAFVAGRFSDVHWLGTVALQEATRRDRFEESWTDAAQDYRPFTGFRISNLGKIDLAFIPSLEEVPQERFVAMVEIAFSSIDIPFDDPKAFTIGAVLLDQNGELRIGAIHAR
jgi:hypothetical protein